MFTFMDGLNQGMYIDITCNGWYSYFFCVSSLCNVASKYKVDVLI